MLLVLFLMLAVAMFAVPAKPGLKRLLTLTDGSTVNAMLVGDEYAHYWLGDDGNAYQSAGNDVYQIVDLQALKQRGVQRRAAANQHRTRRLAPRKVGEVGSITGQKKGLIILVNFTDVTFKNSNTKALYQRIANEVNFSYTIPNTNYSFKGSMYDYFKAQSEGQFELTFDVVGPVTVSNNRAYYGGNKSNGDDKHPAEMVIEALQLADSQVDYADYVWGSGNEVEQVYVVYAGNGEADSDVDDAIWPHEWTLSSAKTYQDGSGAQTLDGVKIDTYACGGELNGNDVISGIGTMCHEFSHCLGYPDFYDTDYSGGQGMFEWDLMDSGSYNDNGYCPAGYTSYERWVAGWKTPTELVNTQTISNMKALQATGSDTYIIYNKENSNEYYLLENRQKTGWDTSLPGKGLLILHVDYSSSAWSNNTPNDDPSHQRMTWVAADNNYQYTMYQGTKYYTEAGAKNDPFPYGSVNAFGRNTTPAATLYNNNSDGTKYLDSSIENITQNNDGTISFNFVGISNVATPTFSPAAGQYADAQTVTISCETSGATIYYTLDGSTPTSSSTVYSSPLTISETKTVKAIAIKGSDQSAVATAKYTIGATTNSLVFEKVTSTDQLETGKRYLIVYETGSLALSSAQTKYRDGQSVTISNNTIDLSSTASNAMPSILTLGGSSTGWTFYDGSTYLGLSSNENALYSLTSNTSDNAKWTVSVTSSSATISNVAFSSRSIQYNTGSPRFACYTSGQQSVALYVEQTATTPAEPVIVADETVTFSTTVGTPETKTFEVLSENLTEDITLTLTDANNVFTLGETTISKSVSDASVSVTFNPSAAGNYTGTVTLTSAGADPVTVSLTGTATANTNPTTSGVTLLYEGLSGYSGADGTNAISASYQHLDYDNWNTLTKVYAGSNTNAYAEGGCLKFGSSNDAGVMTTKSIALTGTGTLTFYLRKYGSDNGSLSVSVTGATATNTSFSASDTWTLCTTNLTGGNGSVTITLTSTKRVYVDEITLVSGSGSTPSTTVAAPTISGTTPFVHNTEVTITAESGASIYYTLDGTTPSSSSTQYSEPFTLTATKTVKAIAVKNNTSSDVTTKTFTAYYQNANNKNGEQLKTSMCEIIYNRTEKSYDYLWTAFQTTDVRSDGKIWDMYSNITNYEPVTSGSTYQVEGNCYNREHSWPQSWFNSATPMYTDLHHIYPTDGFVNGKRSNYPFGETSNPTYTSANNFSKLGPCSYSGYTGTVFEPADEYKGDFARTYFYMVTCYEEKLADWYNDNADGVRATIDGSTYPAFQTWQLNMLMEWAKNDPVSEKETNRNNAVYAIQNNRNPFIDYPGLEEYVWGTWRDHTFSYDNYVQPVYKQDVTMTFSSATATATVGEDFTEPTLSTTPAGLTVTYSSSDTNVATVDFSTGEVTLVAAGTTTITATFAGNDSYNGGTASYTLTVNAAQALPTAPTNLALSDVASTSMTASWSAVTDATSYELDVVQGSSFEPSIGSPVLESDFSDTTGWTLSGTGTYTGADYYGAGSPSIKFDGTGDYIISPEFNSGVKLQFWALGNGGSGSTFAISGLVNNTWTDIKTVSIAQGGATYEVNLPTGTTQVRFDFTKSVNCALDDVVIYGAGNTPVSLGGYPKSVGNVTSTSITGLTPETQYAVRVRAVNGAGNSDWSSAVTATTTVTAIATIPTLAANMAGCTSTSVPVSWTACDGVTSYTLQLARDDQFTEDSQGSQTTLIDESFESNSIPNTWMKSSSNISVANGKSGDGDYCVAFKGNGAYLITPLVENPTNVSFMYKRSSNTTDWSLDVSYSTSTDGPWTNIGTVSSAGTSWNTFSQSLSNFGPVYIKLTDTRSDGGHERYIDLVQISSTSPAVEGSLISSETVNGTSHTFTGLTPETTYYARVKGNADWSNVVSFETNSTIELANKDNNDDVISAAATSGKLYDVTLAGRTLYKDGAWNTLCLPFDVTLSNSPLTGDGMTAKVLNGTASNLNQGTLTLVFTDAQATIEAGTPFIIKWNDTGNHLSAPTFTAVTVNGSAPTPVTFDNDLGDNCQFVGNYSPFVIDATNINEIIMLSGNNTLGYSNNPRSLQTCRAHFVVPTSTNAPGMARYSIDFGDGVPTGIITIDHETWNMDNETDAWYTLDGRKLSGKPLRRGVYINNGQKNVIK